MCSGPWSVCIAQRFQLQDTVWRGCMRRFFLTCWQNHSFLHSESKLHYVTNSSTLLWALFQGLLRMASLSCLGILHDEILAQPWLAHPSHIIGAALARSLCRAGRMVWLCKAHLKGLKEKFRWIFPHSSQPFHCGTALGLPCFQQKCTGCSELLREMMRCGNSIHANQSKLGPAITPHCQ